MVFEIVTGWLFFLAFSCFCFCAATLRFHIDATRLARPGEIDRAIRHFFPRQEILTRSGVIRYKLAIVSLLVAMSTAAVIIAKNLARRQADGVRPLHVSKVFVAAPPRGLLPRQQGHLLRPSNL